MWTLAQIISVFLSPEDRTLKTLDFAIRIVSTQTFLYFDLYFNTAYATHYVLCLSMTKDQRSKRYDFSFYIGSTPTFLYFDLYLYTAYAAHYTFTKRVWDRSYNELVDAASI